MCAIPNHVLLVTMMVVDTDPFGSCLWRKQVFIFLVVQTELSVLSDLKVSSGWDI